ncbi:HDOD domain-containing protein [Rhodanobacter glycinis]|uniref:HDOD domain-containing protein n=2 Tax=Rhodanobacter glycinis TaxID=582702 RepID=A0A502C617_9GAMM|nr:HDOD domain-containing protein [Rhodanobacter glycinis]
MVVNMWRRLFSNRKATISRARPLVATRPGARVPAPDSDSAPPVLSLIEIGDRFHRFVLGLPAAESSEPSAAELATLKRLELLSTRFDMRSLPRLPTVLPQLLRTLKNDNAAGAELAKLVGRDPLMVGEVMRVTSSVFYRSAQPITSLQQAVVLLGQDGLRRVLTQHVMKPILQANAGALGHAAGERLWDHAERCAHACAWLGRSSGCDAFEAYLAGIICHTGTGAVVRLLDQLMPADAETEAAPLSSGFLSACSQLAARLSLQASQHWELPARVIEAMTECQSPATPAGSALGRTLAVADTLAIAQLLGEHDRLAADLDLSHSWPDILAPPLLARCQQDLRRQFPVESKRI